MIDRMTIFGKTFDNVAGIKVTDGDGNVVRLKADGGEPDPLDVDFIDYDGTLLYTYTAQEFLELTALPPNPYHDGLVAQGWNWTLADAKDFVGKYGALVVGQMYTTNTGRSRIYIHLPDTFPTLQVPLRYVCTVAYGTKVYWGDGTEEVLSKGPNSGSSPINHTYTNSGDYVIEIEVLDGEISYFGADGANGSVINGENEAQIVTKVEIGDNVTGLGKNPFKFCRNMETITFPKTLVNQNDYDENMFEFCRNLKAVVFPVNYVGRKRAMFSSYSSVRYVSIPKNQTGFAMSTYPVNLRKLTIASAEPNSYNTGGPYLYNCQQLTHFVVMGTYTVIGADTMRASLVKKLYIPETVTTIQATALCYNRYCEEIHLYPTTPPTLSNASAFNQTTGTFYVPYSADHSILTAYKEATNWSTFADRMVEESET